ncbi:hypothetical protein WN944_013674 [Citrus x changshan-huyou]|uniref:Uncharacterized protein n=1 Tax=Citrus x changshan-huyou TaxID=2935761 RepID=A0AAP0M4F6_9ROSI
MWERTGRPLIDPPIVQKKASTTSIQPLNVSQQATRRRKQIPSGPGQSSNTRGRKRRVQVGSGDAGTRGEQSSQGLSQSENPSQASNVTGSL